MIRVVQFIHGLSIGGAETLVKNYCLLFDKKEIDITVVCLMNHHSAYDRELQEKGIRVIYIYDIIDNMVKGPSVLKKASHRFLGPFVFRHIMYKLKPDIVHTQRSIT